MQEGATAEMPARSYKSAHLGTGARLEKTAALRVLDGCRPDPLAALDCYVTGTLDVPETLSLRCFDPLHAA